MDPKARVPAPGATRLVLTGIMAVPDAHGRLRVMLADPAPGGRRDLSWQTLRRAAPDWAGTPPYEIRQQGQDGAEGVFWAVPPAHRRAYWLGLAEELRGRPVRVEVTVRAYAFERGRASRRGVALDVSSVDPL